MSRRTLVGMAFAVAWTIAPANAHADDDRSRFAGTYRFVGSAPEEAARSAAIDRCVGTLFFAIRGIARSRLSDGTKIEPWISFAFVGGTVQYRTPSSPLASSPVDGTVVDYLSHGDRSKLSQRFGDGRLVQVFAADEGKRTNEWSLAPDGNTLTLRVTISSPKLAVPMVYTLTYKRSA